MDNGADRRRDRGGARFQADHRGADTIAGDASGEELRRMPESFSPPAEHGPN